MPNIVEQVHLNTEVCCLATSIHDKEEDFTEAILATRLMNPFLATELENMMACQVWVNNVHHTHIMQIYALPIFNGDKTLGQRIG